MLGALADWGWDLRLTLLLWLDGAREDVTLLAVSASSPGRGPNGKTEEDSLIMVRQLWWGIFTKAMASSRGAVSHLEA